MIFGTYQCRIISNMSVDFIFINCLYKVAPPTERQQLVLHLLKTKIILSFKENCLTCPWFCCKTHSRRRHNSLTSVRLISATPRCISSHQQTQRLMLFEQTVDDLYLPVFRYTAAVDYSATCPDWLRSTSCAKIPV